MEALILSTVLLMVDWGQTREISTNPLYKEHNVTIGENPSVKRVDLYFSAVIIGNALISTNIKNKKHRRMYDYTIAINQSGVIAGNQSIDIKMNWKF